MVTIAVAVAIMVIGLTVYGSTSERGREYATLKAIGLRRGSLLRLAGRQAVVLALAGTALGTGLAFAGVWAAAALAPKYLIVVTAESVASMGLAALAMQLRPHSCLPATSRGSIRRPRSAMSVPLVRRQLVARRGARSLACLESRSRSCSYLR